MNRLTLAADELDVPLPEVLAEPALPPAPPKGPSNNKRNTAIALGVTGTVVGGLHGHHWMSKRRDELEGNALAKVQKSLAGARKAREHLRAINKTHPRGRTERMAWSRLQSGVQKDLKGFRTGLKGSRKALRTLQKGRGRALARGVIGTAIGVGGVGAALGYAMAKDDG